jgi:hypothetical protein
MSLSTVAAHPTVALHVHLGSLGRIRSLCTHLLSSSPRPLFGISAGGGTGDVSVFRVSVSDAEVSLVAIDVHTALHADRAQETVNIHTIGHEQAVPALVPAPLHDHTISAGLDGRLHLINC